jgi:hypothetical protein
MMGMAPWEREKSKLSCSSYFASAKSIFEVLP